MISESWSVNGRAINTETVWQYVEHTVEKIENNFITL